MRTCDNLIRFFELNVPEMVDPMRKEAVFESTLEGKAT